MSSGLGLHRCLLPSDLGSPDLGRWINWVLIWFDGFVDRVASARCRWIPWVGHALLARRYGKWEAAGEMELARDAGRWSLDLKMPSKIGHRWVSFGVRLQGSDQWIWVVALDSRC
ncbi:hypothetical protein ACLOJK_029376 [Asimina triloba]